MRRSEMNAHQRAMFNLMCEEMDELIGGLENTMLDFAPEDKEYQEAEAFLNQSHAKLVVYFYHLIMGMTKKGAYANHARFAGGEFLKEHIDARLREMGY